MTSSMIALGCLVCLSASGCASFICALDGGAILSSPIETPFCRSSGVFEGAVVAQSAFAAHELVVAVVRGLAETSQQRSLNESIRNF